MTKPLRGHLPAIGVVPAGIGKAQHLYRNLRSMILAGQFAAGTRLASSRQLALSWSCSRGLVEEVVAQLVADGFLLRKRGAGTYVAELPHYQPIASAAVLTPVENRYLQDWNATPFNLSIAFDAFPQRQWLRNVQSALRQFNPADASFMDAQGHAQLRHSIAHYLNETRGVICTPEQIVVTSGSQQSLSILAQLCGHQRDVLCESPCYPGAVSALRNAAARIHALPVEDGESERAQRLEQLPAASVIYLTPAHQYPCGSTLPLSQRLQLLAYARQHDSFIVEDDYDGEFRYDGRSLYAMQGIVQNDQIIYLGTFSKILFPGLRIGYAVLPYRLLDKFIQQRHSLDGFAQAWAQAALINWLPQAAFYEHIRRLRSLYQARRDVVLECWRENPPPLWTLGEHQAGFHIVLWWSDTRKHQDRILAEQLRTQGLWLEAVSTLYLHEPSRNGLILRFGAYSPPQIRAAMHSLLSFLHQLA